MHTTDTTAHNTTHALLRNQVLQADFRQFSTWCQVVEIQSCCDMRRALKGTTVAAQGKLYAQMYSRTCYFVGGGIIIWQWPPKLG